MAVQLRVEDGRRRGTRGVPLVAVALAVVLTLLAPHVPATAGELRTILEAEAGVRSDGNYAQRFQGDGVDGVESEGQELARMGFHLRLSYLLPRLQLALNYSPSYEWMLDDAEINGTTHRLDLGLVANLTRRLELSVRERLLSSPSLDLYGPFSEAEPVVVTRRGDQLSQSLDVGLRQGLTRRASLLLGATHTVRSFEEEGLSDTETLAARIGANWEIEQNRNFDIFATAGYYDFGERLFPDDGSGGPGAPRADRPAREADVQTVNLAWSQPAFRDGRFRVEGGVFSVDSTRDVLVLGLPEEPPVVIQEDDSHTGWRGGVQLSRQMPVFGWNLGYRHDVSAGNGLGRATEVDAGFAGISGNIGRNLVLGLDGNVSRHRDLEDDDPILSEDPDALDRQDRLAEFAAGTARFSWNFSTVARLTGGYSRIWQESRVEPFEDLSYDRYFLGLALQLYRTGEEPREPADAGEMEDDDEPDSQ